MALKAAGKRSFNCLTNRKHMTPTAALTLLSVPDTTEASCSFISKLSCQRQPEHSTEHTQHWSVLLAFPVEHREMLCRVLRQLRASQVGNQKQKMTCFKEKKVSPRQHIHLF